MQNSEVHCYASSCCYNPRVHLYPKWCGIASLMMVVVMMMMIMMMMRRMILLMSEGIHMGAHGCID